MSSSTMLDMYFPPGAQSYKEQLLKVSNHADKISLSRNIYAKFSSPEEAKAILEILQSKAVDGMNLTATQLTRQNRNFNSTQGSDQEAPSCGTSFVSCERVAYLGAEDVKSGSVKSFFNAKDVEDKRAIILKFNSEEEAEAASRKVMSVGDTTIHLAPLPRVGPHTSDAKRKRELNENSDDVQSKKLKQDNDKGEESDARSTMKELGVTFPPGARSYKEPLQKVMNSADSLILGREVIAKFSSRREAEAKLELLRQTSAEGMFSSAALLAKNDAQTGSPKKAASSHSEAEGAPRADDACKRLAHVGSFDSNPETVKVFFDAKHVHFLSREPGNAVLVLTFDTEEEADAASMSVMNLRGKVISLKPFNEQSGRSLNGANSKDAARQNNCEDDDDDDEEDEDEGDESEDDDDDDE